MKKDIIVGIPSGELIYVEIHNIKSMYHDKLISWGKNISQYIYKDINKDKIHKHIDKSSTLNSFKNYTDFYLFLLNHNIIDNFIYNFKHNYPNIQIKDYLDTTQEPNFINQAFSWTNSVEKLKFWYNYNKLWLNNIKKTNYTK